ncbi:hypothetical protein Ddc_23409 [Ditylenchus destructor]|nr:hypothetical protein Ddc_23409 [Ditylenchus destructor]
MRCVSGVTTLTGAPTMGAMCNLPGFSVAVRADVVAGVVEGVVVVLAVAGAVVPAGEVACPLAGCPAVWPEPCTFSADSVLLQAASAPASNSIIEICALFMVGFMLLKTHGPENTGGSHVRPIYRRSWAV